MNIDQIGSDQEQLNDGGIDIDQLFEQIQTEIDAVDNDLDTSNDNQQIEQIDLSFNHLHELLAQVQSNVDQQRIADKLREQFEQLKHRRTELNDLQSQVTQQSPVTKLDPELYTISEADPGQGREKSVLTIKTIADQGVIASKASRFFTETLGLSA